MSFNLSGWYETVENDSVIMGYHGAITSDVVTSSLEDIEKLLEDKVEARKMKRRIYNVMVECLQNLYHHSMQDVLSENNTDEKFAAFLITVNQDGYKIITGNYVDVKRVQVLKDRINQINSLSLEEIKSLYKHLTNLLAVCKTQLNFLV